MEKAAERAAHLLSEPEWNPGKLINWFVIDEAQGVDLDRTVFDRYGLTRKTPAVASTKAIDG